MAQMVTVEFIDDLDGSPAEGTVAFSLHGKSYEIDLSAEHRVALEQALERYVACARSPRAQPGRGTGRRVGRPASREQADIRQWGRDQGYEVNDRGRIPAGIRAQYAAAHA